MSCLTNVNNNESVNDCSYNVNLVDNFDMNVQSNQDNLLYNVHNHTGSTGDSQLLCNISSKMADEFTNSQGQSSYPQVTTQHNRGGWDHI